MRNRGKPEDFRYARWRQEWGRWWIVRSWAQVFMLQGSLALVVSAPVLMLAAAPSPGMSLIIIAAGMVWLVGMAFEVIGDEQLRRFKANPDNQGRIIQHGLWRYTRHPNYFGEALLWWGVWMLTLGTGLAWWAIIGPVTITVLVRFVSGVPLLEQRYEGRDDWAEYQRRTNVFVPMPPRSG